MEKDFLKELGYLGVTARIKRLSDALFYSIKELYDHQGIDIEPSWHLVLLSLKQEDQVTMLDLAKWLNLSKPAITKMVNKMQRMGYVDFASDQNDQRKKIVQLSAKAKKELPKLERIWNAGQKTVEQMLENNPMFLEALSDFEKQQTEQSFSERAIKKLNP